MKLFLLQTDCTFCHKVPPSKITLQLFYSEILNERNILLKVQHCHTRLNVKPMQGGLNTAYMQNVTAINISIRKMNFPRRKEYQKTCLSAEYFHKR